MAFDPDAFLSGGTAVAEPPAFDPDAFLNGGTTPPFDPDAFLADSSPAQSSSPNASPVVGQAPDSGGDNVPLPTKPGNAQPDPSVALSVDQISGLDAEREASDKRLQELNGTANLGTAALDVVQHPIKTAGGMLEVGQMAREASGLTTPLIDLPKPENTSAARGVVRGVEGSIEGIFTPENALVMSGLSGAPAALQKLAAAGFGATMIKGAVDEFQEAGNAATPGERAEGYTKAVLSLLMGGLAAKHGTGVTRTAITPAERAASMDDARLAIEQQKQQAPVSEAASKPTTAPQESPLETPPSEVVPANPVALPEATPEIAKSAIPEPSKPNAGATEPQPPTAPTTLEAPAPKPVELLPEQADISAPVLDVKRSPFALGISPDSKALNWLASNTKRLFTATGDLPKETFERWIERNGFVKAESRQVAYATRDLYSALKNEFGISKGEELTKGFEKVPPEFVKQMNGALLGEVDINTLPEKVRAPLQAMREHIDQLSFKMLEEGVIPESLQAKVADNLGVYMTRSYRVFDDPKWAEKIPQDVRNRTRDFILSNLKKENPAATPETARSVMEAMLQDWKDQGSGALVKQGGKIGSKDLTSLIDRKDIPKVIREVMGEYHDPVINYARSVTKAANLIGSQRFLNQVKAEGVGKFLFEDGQQPASHSALIAAEGSDVMAPLNGLRTTPEIAAAFREFGKSDPIKNVFLRALARVSGVAKTAKTVGSLMTQARNTLGQAYFFAMNGHFDLTKAAPALKAVMADLGAKDTPAGRTAYQRYLRLGIVDQSARASELRDTIRDAGLNDPSVSLTEPGQVMLKSARKLTLDAAAKAYQVSDDLGKIVGFENELARQREIHPDWSETTLEAATAERIRNTYPTYSMVPEGVRKIRQLPIAPFASFAAETFRTAYHNLRYTIEDLRSDNPAQKKAGAQRLAGQLAVLGSGYALAAASRALLGMNAKQEDDARRFMAPWDKDSQIMFTGKGEGSNRYVNLSYVNPYSYLTDPVISVASGLTDKDQLDDIMLRSFGKLMQPFTSEDILAGALVDIARNQTQTGRRVFNPGDTPAKQWEDKLAHIYATVEPGTLTRIKGKIIPAIKGETDSSGRKPELSNEILSELTGFKTQTLDYKQGIGYRAQAFKKADDDADSIFREVAARRGAVKPNEITESYQRSAASKFKTWQGFYRDIEAARRSGVKNDDIRTAIEARGVSSSEAGAVMAGRFVPPQISPAISKIMKAAGRTTPPEVSNEMQRGKSLVLSGSFK